MSDYLIKSLVDNDQFRAYAVDATELVREAQRRHDTWAASSAALGRSLVATLLLSSSVLKGEETMTVRINGGGPVGGIVIDGNAKGTVKGYLQEPHVNLPLNDHHKIDVSKAVGVNGFLSVTKDLGLDQPILGRYRSLQARSAMISRSILLSLNKFHQLLGFRSLLTKIIQFRLRVVS